MSCQLQIVSNITRNIISLIIFLFITTVSFNAQAFDLFGKKLPDSITYEILDSELQPYNSLTEAQKNALLALEARVRGISEKKIKNAYGVALVGDDLAILNEVIEKLEIENVILDADPKSNDQTLPFSGYITFADEVGRSLQLGFILQINENTNGQRVQVINLNPIFWGTPNIELFVIPEKALDASTSSAEKDYIALYKNLTSKSLNINDIPYAHDKYFIVAFFKSLIPPGVLVSLKVADDKDGAHGNVENNKFQVFDGGWMVAIQPLEANLQKEMKWAKVTYQTDDTIYKGMDDSERIVGLFQLGTSRGDY